MSSTDPASQAVLVSETRRLLGLSQRELAAKAHTSQSAIARIESGDVNPTVATLSRLLSAMGCTLTLGAEFTPQLVDELLERSEELRAMSPTKRVQSIVDILHRVEWFAAPLVCLRVPLRPRPAQIHQVSTPRNTRKPPERT